MLQRRMEEEQAMTIDLSASSGRSVEDLPSVAGLISPGQHQRFLKKLFGGDAANYRSLLVQLDTFASWPEAHHYLEDYFQEHNINPYCDEAVRFSDLVYLRYFPADVYVYTVHESFAQTDLRFLPFLQPAH